MFRLSNPTLNEQTFDAFHAQESSDAMTLEGTAIKAGALVAVTAFAATWTWQMCRGAMAGNLQTAIPWAIGGSIVGLILAFVTVYKKEWSPITAPLYAVAEGLFLGAISALADIKQPGVAFQAICLTFATLFSLLIAFRLGIIEATERLKLGIVTATGAICLVYIVTWILQAFQMPGALLIHQTGWIGIGFSLFVVGIAALNLILDFDFIEKGVERGAPKYMEWYAAFGLLVTLVWLYLEILRLLGKLRDRK